MSDIGLFLQSIGPAIDIAKGIASIDDKQRLLDVLVRSQLLAGENAERRSKVLSLEQQLQFKDSVRFDANAYWSGNPEDPGPFCSACWDGARRAVHLRKDLRWTTSYDCPVCKQHFATGERSNAASRQVRLDPA